METLRWILLGVIVLTSIMTIFFVLLNKGKGGGLSDMFGGGMTSSLNSSGVASRNLVRLTVTTILIWVFAIIGYGLVLRFDAV
ncbi:preprotein translocase subunit SecG [Rothia kristinae]|uniref:Protein-export membrane protein SecG n=1 Tax=Rothia kristinae TaxID=37923 RepID=A0A7T3CIJ9_9MICC|nr:preprotein translocase subunit SecG [Rothia kristinae]TDP57022.1 preprotein translocase subunit SecG [Kocuria sp. AG109]SIL76466.1 protein-export membrane protein (translocase subunit) SecG [Mycobacteroides abscessus subsp. abscessus]KTR39706.1 preprotein translocase subunit SecG [Rothia kristinae]KTR58330.1 preprotein translocase subunit SecG [Rothia kristinae]KTR62924.1 preprotein translocase subunit SecG [Rothia kristinae]